MEENDFPEIPDSPQLPDVLNSIERVAQTTQRAAEAIATSGILDTIGRITQAFSYGTANLIESTTRVMQDYLVNYADILRETTEQLIEAIANFEIPSYTEDEQKQLIESNQLWGQYGWTYIPSMPLRMFNTPPESIMTANKMAMQYCSSNEMSSLFERLHQWKLNHKDLDSAIYCYQNKQYKAAALMLCGLIDSKLIRLQSDSRRPVGAKAVQALKTKYENDGEKMLINFTQIIFGNGCVFGGNLYFTNHADVTDGLASYMTITDTHGLNSLSIILKIMKKKIDRLGNNVKLGNCNSIEIRSMDGMPLFINFDGELVECGDSCRVEIVRKGLNFVVPKDFDVKEFTLN